MLCMRIAINGMGRIGRTFFRVLYERGNLHKLVAVNDIMPREHLMYLLQYDSVRGNFPVRITECPEGIRVGDQVIHVFQESQTARIPWASAGADVVVESTGAFTDRRSLEGHLQAGAKVAILTTTGTPDIPLYVLGVNEASWHHDSVFSIGSCTVNGTAPIIKMLSGYSPASIYLNMIHAYSSRQNILDSYYPEIRRSRAASDNIIPLTINLGASLQRLFPALKDSIHAITTRVPVPCGVLADVSCVLKNPPASVTDWKLHWEKAAAQMPGIMAVTTDPIVSTDILNNRHSLVIDQEFTHVMHEQARVMAWFDNEWGFSNRILDWIGKVEQ
jgi:glyceraldehyde 3-phosphate dehydrogenase